MKKISTIRWGTADILDNLTPATTPQFWCVQSALSCAGLEPELELLNPRLETGSSLCYSGLESARARGSTRAQVYSLGYLPNCGKPTTGDTYGATGGGATAKGGGWGKGVWPEGGQVLGSILTKWSPTMTKNNGRSILNMLR